MNQFSLHKEIQILINIKHKKFQKDNGRKGIKLNQTRHKSMRNPERTCQNKMLLPAHFKNAYKMKFTDLLRLPFLDQPESDVVVFAMIYSDIFEDLVTKRKHGIYKNDKVKFNETK